MTSTARGRRCGPTAGRYLTSLPRCAFLRPRAPLAGVGRDRANGRYPSETDEPTKTRFRPPCNPFARGAQQEAGACAVLGEEPGIDARRIPLVSSRHGPSVPRFSWHGPRDVQCTRARACHSPRPVLGVAACESRSRDSDADADADANADRDARQLALASCRRRDQTTAALWEARDGDAIPEKRMEGGSRESLSRVQALRRKPRCDQPSGAMIPASPSPRAPPRSTTALAGRPPLQSGEGIEVGPGKARGRGSGATRPERRSLSQM